MGDGFFERLMEILQTEKQTWWAEKTNTSQSMVSNYWFKGKYPRGDKIFKILELKNISANWLFFNIGPKSLEYLDDNAIDEKQNANRETQIKIMELTQENIRLNEALKRCEIALKQKKLVSGLKKYVDTQGDGYITNTIMGSISLLKMMIDITIKMAEMYSKSNLDEDGYMKIINWIESNLESQKYSAASKLKDLEKLIG